MERFGIAETPKFETSGRESRQKVGIQDDSSDCIGQDIPVQYWYSRLNLSTALKKSLEVLSIIIFEQPVHVVFSKRQKGDNPINQSI